MVFSAETRAEAWLSASEYLLDEGDELNIILEISSPGLEQDTGRFATRVLNEVYEDEGELPVHTVAETIFPGWEYRHRGLAGVFETYAAEYDIIRSSPKHGWGTYAHRLISRPTADESTINPLETLIEKMRRAHSEGPKYRGCYELGIAEGAYDVPLYNNAADANRLRGGPCLSHLSFKLVDDEVHLTALYRSHDYRFKVPGNLLGLARLQACVAKEVGAATGELVVHSTLAYLRRNPSLARFREAVGQIRGAFNGG